MEVEERSGLEGLFLYWGVVEVQLVFGRTMDAMADLLFGPDTAVPIRCEHDYCHNPLGYAYDLALREVTMAGETVTMASSYVIVPKSIVTLILRAVINESNKITEFIAQVH